MAVAMNDIDVDSKYTKLIIRTRLDMEEEFIAGKKKKSVLWGRILEKIKEQKPDCNLTKDQINRKFINLQTTYKRIKARNKESGRSATTWDFFEDFDEIYGTRHYIDPPAVNLISSLGETPDTENAESSPERYLGSPVSSVCEPQAKKPKRGNQNGILKHLEEESRKEQKRHDELMAMEERKLIVEQQRVNAMIDLKDILERTIGNN